MARTSWPDGFTPVIVEEITEPATGWLSQARIGAEVPPGVSIPLRTTEIEQFIDEPVAVYARLENGDIWRLQWKAHHEEGVEVRVFPDGSEKLGIDKLSVARAGHTETHLPTAEEYINGFRVGAPFRGSRITEILIETAECYDYEIASAWTRGRYSDLRTRDRIGRNTEWSRHYGQGPKVVDLGDDHNGCARYGVQLELLDAPVVPEASSERIGLHGEYQYAIVATGGDYRAWHLIRPGGEHALPLATGMLLDVDDPNSPRIEAIYGVVAPDVMRGRTPMNMRPIEDPGIDAAVLRGFNARLRGSAAMLFDR